MIILSTHKTEISSKRTSLIISKICTYYFREFKTGQFVMRVNRDENIYIISEIPFLKYKNNQLKVAYYLMIIK